MYKRWYILCSAVTCFIALSASAISFDDARHLLNRTGFGATPEDIEKLTALSWTKAVDSILSTVTNAPTTDKPYWADEPVGGLSTLRLRALAGMRGADVQLERAAIRRRQEAQRRNRITEMRTWWWNEMIRTQSPMTERMVLFWHNHFTSEISVVNSAELMFQQNQLFRSNALGNFADLVMAATKDAAMIIYLDNNSNVKGNPNENFARELMELFTLGEGHVYTEEDVREAARAFTGWRVNNLNKRFQFEENLHDFGEKKFIGKKGDFDGDDIVQIILALPRTAEFVTEKMWKCFISEDMDEEAIKGIAKKFRDSKYDMMVLARAILMSDHFRAGANRGNMIKSPVDLVVGACRMFETHPAQSQQISAYGTMLGQNLFQPPDVSGWKSGAYWIDANTLITRHQLSRLVLARPDEAFVKNFENRQKQRRLARLRADRERREIEHLLKGQKSMLEDMMEAGGDDMEISMDSSSGDMDIAVDKALDNQMKPEDQVAMEFKSLKPMDMDTWIKEKGLDGKGRKRLVKTLLPIAPVHGIEDMMMGTDMVASILLDPAFQLK
jgi:uncharacterized protein (DUF1800 family)